MGSSARVAQASEAPGRSGGRHGHGRFWRCPSFERSYSRALKDVPDGTVFSLTSELGESEKSFTWNAVGKIAAWMLERGCPAERASRSPGIGPAVKGDSIYNGADDDAPARLRTGAGASAGSRDETSTHHYLCFVWQRRGGRLGSTWFQGHSPVPLDKIAANLEFEMIVGRPEVRSRRALADRMGEVELRSGAGGAWGQARRRQAA